MSTPIKLYRHALSGHSHRAELMLALLQLPYELVDVDLAAGSHKQPDFLALNPFGKVPVLDDNGVVIWDSNAILIYLAEKYDAEGRYYPADPAQRAAIQGWLSIAAGEIAYGPAAARLITLFKAQFNAEEVIARAHQLLAIVDKVLAHKPFLTGERLTLADIAAYAYIARAPEGNVALGEYPYVQAWLASIEAQPGFVPIATSPVGLVA